MLNEQSKRLIYFYHFFPPIISYIPRTLRIQIEHEAARTQLSGDGFCWTSRSKQQEQTYARRPQISYWQERKSHISYRALPCLCLEVWLRLKTTNFLSLLKCTASLFSHPCIFFFNKLHMSVIENISYTMWIPKSLKLISTSLKGHLRKMGIYSYA